MTNKNFEKLNIKIVIGMQQCTPATNFIQFGELQFQGPNLPKKHFWTNLVKRNLGITYFK